MVTITLTHIRWRFWHWYEGVIWIGCWTAHIQCSKSIWDEAVNGWHFLTPRHRHTHTHPHPPLAGSRDTSRRHSGKAVRGGWPLCPCCPWSSCRSCAASRSSSWCSSRSSLWLCRSFGPGCSLSRTGCWSRTRWTLGRWRRRRTKVGNGTTGRSSFQHRELVSGWTWGEPHLPGAPLSDESGSGRSEIRAQEVIRKQYKLENDIISWQLHQEEIHCSSTNKSEAANPEGKGRSPAMQSIWIFIKKH